MSTEIIDEATFAGLLESLGGDVEFLTFHVRGVEGDLLGEFLHHGHEPAGAYILRAGVDVGGDARYFAKRVVVEADEHALGGQERFVLAGEGVFWLLENAEEIVFVE